MKAFFGLFDKDVVLLIGLSLVGLIHQLQVLLMQ